jgi:hypothetical protein
MTCLALRLHLPEGEEEGEEEEGGGEEEGPHAHRAKWELKLSKSVGMCAGLGGSFARQQGGQEGVTDGAVGGGERLDVGLMDAQRLLLQVCLCACVCV